MNSTDTTTEDTSNPTVAQHEVTVNSTAPEISVNSTAAYELNSTASHRASHPTSTSLESNSTATHYWESNSTATHWESNSTATPWESNSTVTPWPWESNSTEIHLEANSTATPYEFNSTAKHWKSNATITPTANATLSPTNIITTGRPNVKRTDLDHRHNHFPHEGWHFTLIGSGATLGATVVLVLLFLLILFRRRLCKRVKYNRMRRRSHSEIQSSQRQKHCGSKAYGDLVNKGFKNGRVSDNIDDIVAEDTKNRVRMQSFKMNRKPSWGFSRKSRKVSAGEQKEHDNGQGVNENV